ncbi:MAG: polysaccharide deacetylase family protein [Anaerolineales bacterium]|nr:polysaccharide deacetylase family protein [Anaerolineales bacterium]MDX9935632.1 polysaccharide deacetylase family protein [Anaerolineales bacterium]
MTKRIFLTLLLFASIISACSPASTPAPTVDANAAMTQAFATVNAALTATASASAPEAPTETPVPSATPTRSGPPPELPPAYRSGALNPLDTPHTYISDSCQYLRAKWDPNNSAPGTIVMAIMFHSIEQGVQSSSNPMHIGSGDFKRLMKNLHDFGFQAITASQLADFLDTNAKIPARSVILIQDDRHSAENYNDWFRPYWQELGWPVVNAWISFDDSIRARILAENIALGQEGLVDFQSHGTIHNINMTDASSDEYIRSELQGSVTDLEQNFGKKPVAIIWPGGGFGIRPVQIAREFGFRIGFTTHPRGPIMFNWIPLADADDPGRPAYVSEGYVNDPRMVLPRYWPSQVLANLDTVRIIGNEAAAYAGQNKAVELDYYDIVCAPTLGPIPALAP